ncbi:acetyl-CoA carboxylase carboxyl transferase subunit alpha [Labrenzia sp. EL_208]|uniref:Acetyl-coenzyme A carboxylase carboxyl transferase subunit alpha n=2 Tax=Roseibium album TaxID=311410 RepID=A0A0M6ZA56_9HYPH|nr:acetyl-CoA carboxylase carboxyl transferase subunit alpha [Labrenzia sp. EL_132]MBG6228904.1 acetyl-CoA carboxylase carboxyl transferase subunit alpha [Labrenzia sp. EL_208]CTQ58273.1 Acetyl-coenzyme A carboxylase carboxyl transferase subunit alpha [Roseibium album]CTQ66033.1 Acetyl-coenzyme A carboxylase carboxyl transferase subunit alpha [Roseibium album]CTQ70980.1 Acetyl-coenzyme A carboxylase carboxyl transferase subunit alpha [Roseibium album]
MFRVNKYMHSYLEFEKPVADIEGKIQELRAIAAEDGEAVNVDGEIERLNTKSAQTLQDLYSKLTPWQKTLVARHPDRPHAVDYVAGLVEDFTPLAGDRKFAEDHALIAGIGRFRGQSVAILAQEKGHDTETRLKHNFGMVRPEGYRKAVRIMELAERFGIPLLSFVDTSGAYPGRGAEERGQSEAIARSTDIGLGLGVPSVAVVIGEGGSGGAIAIATANKVLMMEHAIYSVISPEGAASILWRDSAKAQDAATALKITAQDLKQLGVIDDIIVEPVGGAHRAREIVIDTAGKSIEAALEELSGLEPEEIRKQRREKFVAIGRTLS